MLNILNEKEKMAGIVAVAMEAMGHSNDSINKVCSSVVALFELGDNIKIMKRANVILQSCMLLDDDVENNAIKLLPYLNK